MSVVRLEALVRNTTYWPSPEITGLSQFPAARAPSSLTLTTAVDPSEMSRTNTWVPVVGTAVRFVAVVLNATLSPSSETDGSMQLKLA